MSETHGAEGAEETFDMTDVPMDGEDTGPADDDQGGDDDEAGGEPPERKAAADKAPLSAEEVNKRYENTRTALSEERRTRRALERRLEALERGDRAPAAERPQRQAQALQEADIDPEEYAGRTLDIKKSLPWSHLDMGLDEGYLAAEWEKAKNLAFTIPCFENCKRCGVCKEEKDD